MGNPTSEEMLERIQTAKDAALRLSSALQSVQHLEGVWPPAMLWELIQSLCYEAGIYAERISPGVHGAIKEQPGS